MSVSHTTCRAGFPLASGEKTHFPEFGTKQDGIHYMERPGVYALIENNEGQIAVIETSNGYFLPGGGIDNGESNADALKREILEEIGYQVSGLIEISEAVEYIEALSDKKHYQIHSRFYKVQLGSKVREDVEKDHRLVWLRQEEAVKLLKRQGQVWVVQSMRNG
ncbi:MAG: NUDIX domain-containing protein [Chloroflexota bacterium]